MGQRLIFLGILCLVILTGCGSSEEEIRATVIAELTSEAPKVTETATLTSTPTDTLTPTITLTPTKRPTRTQTSTPTSTQTPGPGAFSNPATIGETVSRYESSERNHFMTATLLDVVRGEEANNLARSEIDWVWYEAPINGQEYLGVKVKLVYLRNDHPNQVEKINPWRHLTLRYSEDGNDIAAHEFTDVWTEGYVPIEAEGWVFF